MSSSGARSRLRQILMDPQSGSGMPSGKPRSSNNPSIHDEQVLGGRITRKKNIRGACTGAQDLSASAESIRPKTIKPGDPGNDTPRKKIKKSKRRHKSAAKLLQLPEAPHDRLQTLHMRLNLPKPTFVVTKREEYCAVIDGDNTEVNDDDVVWHKTAREAKMYAAAEACPGLEAMLVKKLARERDGQGDDANRCEIREDRWAVEEVDNDAQMQPAA